MHGLAVSHEYYFAQIFFFFWLICKFKKNCTFCPFMYLCISAFDIKIQLKLTIKIQLKLKHSDAQACLSFFLLTCTFHGFVIVSLEISLADPLLSSSESSRFLLLICKCWFGVLFFKELCRFYFAFFASIEC